MKDRMRNRIVCAIILSSTTLCLGASWTWDGPGIDWINCGNWQAGACSGMPGYPSTTNDDVNFSVDAFFGTPTFTIDDMVMAHNVEFCGDAGAVLTVDSLLFDATAQEVTLTVGGALTVVADGTN